jgi:hypothetical protein
MMGFESLPVTNSIGGMYADNEEVMTTRLTDDDLAAAFKMFSVMLTAGCKKSSL